MRTRQELNIASAAAIASQVVTQSDIKAGKRYIEFRFTCKKATGGNKVAFYFHGGRMIENDGKFFASFRPLPWAKNRQGEFKLNADGSHQRNPVWAKVVSAPVSTLSAQEMVLVAAAKDNPTVLSLLPAHIQEAVKSPEINYQDFDLQTWVETFSQGMDNVKFTFNVPSNFKPMMENLKNLIDSEENVYSLVMRFDLDEPIYGLSELNEVYDSEELEKSFPLKPTYVGFIQEVTKSDLPKSAFINPALVNSAMDKAIAAATIKKEEWLHSSYLSNQSAAMAERLERIGRGKKAHHPILEEMNAAAEAGNTQVFAENAAVLLAVAERGENPHLPVEKAKDLIEKAESIASKKTIEVTEEPASEVVSVDILDNLFD
jgi:hypothetical protein